MSWKVAIIVAALVFPVCAGADVYVRREAHTDGYYAGGSMNPPDDSVVEIWIGDKRMAYVNPGMKVVVDAEKKTLVFVNRRDNTYVKTALPLDLASLFSEEELGTLQVYKRAGSVKKTEAGKKIGKRDCTAYQTRDWIDFEGGRVAERSAEIWVTTDVPFDLKAFDTMYANMRKLGNFSDDYMEQLSLIRGFEMAGEQTSFNESVAVTTTSSVVELTEKDPAPGTYSVPDGCTEKELLTLQDLRN